MGGIIRPSENECAFDTLPAGIRERRLRGVKKRLLVVGQGFVGQALSREAADREFDVTGFDVDVAHAARLDRTVRYRVVSDPDEVGAFDIAVIAVPTVLAAGVPDLSHLRSAARLIGRTLSPGALVVVESTVYPGVTRDVVAPALSDVSGLRPGTDFGLGYSPERLNPGPRSPGLTDVPRVVAGIDDESLRRTREFYDALVPATHPVSSIEVAELSKLIENTFRHINIAFVNELALAEPLLGVDVREALDAAGSKPYGFMKFTPGVGVGGDCIPVSPAYLDWALTRRGGHALRFTELANDIDRLSSTHVVDHVESVLTALGKPLSGARVLLVGVAYKKDVPEVRSSAALRIGRLLRERGAVTTAADPLIPSSAWPDELDRIDLVPEAIAEHDIVVVLVRHTDIDVGALASSDIPILDTGRTLSGPTVIAC
ncbi:nucleotide sugar dehydrogenase [Rathayibacter sp. YIM 133350]|uniref:nucleotide sugar dehydrogenase n=1 Tax=Rathayibacter sp. YIM 133350 TaxID=3131992 RepID=UPI00307E2168